MKDDHQMTKKQLLSDVLGGCLLGMSWLILGIVLTEWKRAGHQSGKK